jgi:hypothetical protein
MNEALFALLKNEGVFHYECKIVSRDICVIMTTERRRVKMNHGKFSFMKNAPNEHKYEPKR